MAARKNHRFPNGEYASYLQLYSPGSLARVAENADGESNMTTTVTPFKEHLSRTGQTSR